MRVITKSRLREFWEEEPESEAPLLGWYQAAKHATWENFGDVREAYGHADQVGKFTVFNIGGNKFRLITHIHFSTSIVYIHCVLTHKDYDAGKWKSG
jgi:mRNA interferase HigB